MKDSRVPWLREVPNHWEAADTGRWNNLVLFTGDNKESNVALYYRVSIIYGHSDLLVMGSK